MKTLNGHFVMHVAMCAVSFNIDLSKYELDQAGTAAEEGGKLYDENKETYELLVFQIVRWSHLLCAVLLMLSFVLKTRQEFIMSKNLMLIVGISYFFPILLAMWALRNVVSIHKGNLD